MATRKFCDYCDDQITPENSGPLVRELSVSKFAGDSDGFTPIPSPLRASIMVVNEHNHVVPDICHKCQLNIVTDGKTVQLKDLPKIAALQPPVAADAPPPVSLFTVSPIKAQPLPATPPPPPPLRAEPPAEETPSVFVPSTAQFPASQ